MPVESTEPISVIQRAAPAAPAGSVAGERSPWRVVALPSEHGGWGLTCEPVLLGLLLAWSWPGLAIGVAALLAFLVRTPLKLLMVDRRRHRSLPRTRLAARVAAIELAALAGLGALAVSRAGWSWLVPVALALPLFGVELWFDIRSRGRRLVPELCGAVGIAATSAAIVLAGGGAARLAIGVWLILAARAVGSIPFVRTQIYRLHARPAPAAVSDAFQGVGMLIAVAAVLVEWPVVLGSGAVAALAVAQLVWVRRPVPPAKQLGLLQLGCGLGIVVATAIGVLAWT